MISNLGFFFPYVGYIWMTPELFILPINLFLIPFSRCEESVTLKVFLSPPATRPLLIRSVIYSYLSSTSQPLSLSSSTLCLGTYHRTVSWYLNRRPTVIMLNHRIMEKQIPFRVFCASSASFWLLHDHVIRLTLATAPMTRLSGCWSDDRDHV